MKFNGINKDLQNNLLETLNNAEDKSAAIIEVFERLNEESHKELIAEVQSYAEAMNANAATAEELGLRTAFSSDEKKFYEGIMQAVTFDQDAVIPTETIDRTLNDVKLMSDTLSLVNMAPAGVKKWITGTHSGTGAWGTLSATLTSELTAALTSFDIEACKAYVLLVVPKAVRDLGMPLVDKYFSAILAEAMHDVLVTGYISGNGVNAPIGLKYKLPNASGTVAAKTVVTNVTGFSPAQLAPVKTTLSNGGKRAVNRLHVIASPATVYQYIDPALYAQNIGGQFVQTSKDEIIVHEEPSVAAGEAIITIENAYTMGMSGIRVDEYKEAKALDDADLFVGKCYANGRPDDDNTAVVIDATKLKEFTYKMQTQAASV